MIAVAATVVIAIIILILLLSKCERDGEGTFTSRSDSDPETSDKTREVTNEEGGDQPGVPSHKHSFGDWKVTAEPTCLTPGSRERSCASCGEKQTEELSPLGHNVLNNACVRCGRQALVENFRILPDRENPDVYMIERCGNLTDPDILIIFDDCPVLETIYYEGSGSDWAKITIDSDNEVLNSLKIVYNYKG